MLPVHEAGNANKLQKPIIASFCPGTALVTPLFFQLCCSTESLSAALRPQGPLDECIYPDLCLGLREK